MKKLIVIALCFAVLLNAALPALAATNAEKIDALREKSRQLQSRIDEAEAQMKSIENDISAKKEYANSLSRQITDLQTQIDVLNQSIDVIQSEIDASLAQIEEKDRVIGLLTGQIAQTQEEINDCSRRISETYDKLKERIRSLYVNGSVSVVELLLNSGSFTAYLEGLELMDSMAKHDDRLIRSIRSDAEKKMELQRELDQDVRKQEQARVELEDSKSLLEENRAALEENKAAVAANKQKIEEKWNEVQETISYLDERSTEFQALVEVYTAQMNEATEEIDRLMAEQVRSGRLSSGTGEISGAGFIWPAPYAGLSVSVEFGQLSGYHSKPHGGMDINVPGDENYDKAAVAAAGGTVATAAYHNSYGNYVVIDHGNGLSTLYAHLYRINVTVGQSVSQGQQIGIIGQTGRAFGAHLHFEVRVNGARRNPRNYLP